MSSDRRLELHEILCNILGSRHVYFQPPETVKMEYPAIVYNRDYIRKMYANDHGYMINRRYSVTLIDKNPDSEFIDKILALPMCEYDRHFTSDNLNHEVFTLYY